MSDANQLARVEAYSDGVFAIAATLLVLGITVPSVGAHASHRELWDQMAALWPSYLAFVIGFGTILIIWVNHHNAIRMLTRTSTAFLYANGLLLLTVTFISFPTAVLARYIATDLASVGVVFYAASSLVTKSSINHSAPIRWPAQQEYCDDAAPLLVMDEIIFSAV